MYEQKYKFSVKSLSPLLMHWDNIEWADQMAEERTELKASDRKNFKAGDDRCPAHSWKGYVYNDGEQVVIPSDVLRSTLLKAGARVTLDGRKSYKELTQCGILFDDMYYPLYTNGGTIGWKPIEAITGAFKEQADTVAKMGFRLFVKRAVVGQAKHVRVRPRFEEWAFTGVLTVVDQQLTEEALLKIWQIAGLYIGWCDWRPGSPKSPGPFGRGSVDIKKVG